MPLLKIIDVENHPKYIIILKSIEMCLFKSKKKN